MKSISIKSIIAVGAIACCIVTAIVVNADNQTSQVVNAELTEVSAAAEASNIIDNMFDTIVSSDDEVDDIASGRKIARLFASKKLPEYDTESAVAVYPINDILNIDDHGDNYQYIVPVKKADDVIALVTMNKGKSLDELQPTIDALDVSEEQHQKIIDKVSARSGQWYAAYMEEIEPENASIFNEDEVAKQLREIGISSMNNMTYFRYMDIIILQISTDEGNYIIPWQVSEKNDIALENKVYSEAEFNVAISSISED